MYYVTAPLAPGIEVEAAIDAERRWDLTTCHTAQHAVRIGLGLKG